MQTDANLRRIRVLHLEDTEDVRLLRAGILQESDFRCERKVVAVSSPAQESARKTAQADVFSPNPFTAENLLTKVRKMLMVQT